MKVHVEAVRGLVLMRDNYTCVFCRSKGTSSNLQAEYDVPLTRGGPDDISNLQTVCKACGRRKQDMTGSEFRRFMRTEGLRRLLWT